MTGTSCWPNEPWQGGGVAIRNWLRAWPIYRQLTGADPWGRGKAVESNRSATLVPRTATADRVAHSVCPYCAVGCAQKVYVKDERVVQIEGDPDSPISRGRLCPKGSASKQLVTGEHRARKVLYRAPFGTEWQELDLDAAMDMVVDRVLNARRKGWQDTDEDGNPLHRTLGIASLGGATLDNEENYLIKKLFTALGAVQIENQARI
jgi:formate dehydrogenase major subunit